MRTATRLKWLSAALLASAPFRTLGSRNWVLVVNPSSLGDMLVFRGFLSELRRQWPDEKIMLVCRQECEPLISDMADEIVSIAWNQMGASGPMSQLSRFRTGLRILKHKYSRALHPVFSTMGLAHDICHAADSPVKIAFRGNYSAEGESSAVEPVAIYSELVDVDRNMHELDKLALFCRTIGLKGVQHREGILPSWNPKELRMPHAVCGFEKKIAVCIGARYKKKDWSPKKFAELIRKLGEEKRSGFLLLGGSDDQDKAADIVKECPGASIANMCGSTTTSEAIDVIAGCDLCIGNDTFGLHAAIVAGTPSVVIMGGGDYPRWIPWKDTAKHRMVTGHCEHQGCGWQCKYEGDDLYRCVRSVKVEDVLHEAEALLLEEVEGAK